MRLFAPTLLIALGLAFPAPASPADRPAVRSPAEDRPAAELRPASAFTGISDRRQRSIALFLEAGRVITDPRCVNCHPATRRPTQGLDQHPHIPAVTGGPDGHGVPGLGCGACHQDRNTPVAGSEEIRSIPGNPKWALAPAGMAWEGRSLGQICVQLKDPARNGGRTLGQIQAHMAHDRLVAWGWSPGAGRRPAPGSQQRLGELIQAWIDNGAACPDG